MRSLPAGQPGPAHQAGSPPPVEYLAAVDRFLAQASLGTSSRRVYRVSLAGWAWPLVGEAIPHGARRRAGLPPMVPLALLDDPGTGARLTAAAQQRAADAGPRTVNRELSCLRSAVAWWQEQGWIRTNPASGLRSLATPPAPAGAPLRAAELASLLRASPSLREHALWRLLADSGAPAMTVLALDAGQLDLARHRARLPGRAGGGWLRWSARTTELLRWLTAGRADGPVFLSWRQAPMGAAPADRCPVTGRARLSYRRAAEILLEVSRPLDPAGRGWTLQQLSRARASAAGTGRR